MVKMNFAIIGCGRIGTRHAEHIDKLGNLKAVCDIDELKGAELALKYNCKHYLKLSDLLKAHPEIDLVAICTPNALHVSHSIESLKSGFHVLCEKPMALSTADCGEMIMTAEKANRRLFIVKQNRYNPPIVLLKDLINENKLGQISTVHLNCFWNRNDNYYKDSWKGSKEIDGGTLYTQFSHFIDLLYWLFGDVIETKSFFKNDFHRNSIEFEDCGVAILKFKNGIVANANFSINSYEKNMEGSLTVMGEFGTVKVGGQYLNELEYCHIKDMEVGNLPEGNKANNYGQYQGSMSNHREVYENVIDVLTRGGSITTSGFEGLKTVEIIEKIYSDGSK